MKKSMSGRPAPPVVDENPPKKKSKKQVEKVDGGVVRVEIPVGKKSHGKRLIVDCYICDKNNKDCPPSLKKNTGGGYWGMPLHHILWNMSVRHVYKTCV